MKLTQDQFVELFERATQLKSKGLREGQSLMGALYEINPDLYSCVPAAVDPFYVDELVPDFIKFLTN